MSTHALTHAPDLRISVPRSPNDALGGYVLLPRIIDKCRALVAGTNGEYNYNCPLDRQFFDWAQVDAEQFQAEIAAGKTDQEMLAWVESNSKATTETEILAWSYRMRWRRPEGEQMQGYFEQLRVEVAPHNYRVETWFQLLDADEKRF
jgi:hypothetical protein